MIVGNFLGGEALAAVGSSGSLRFSLTGFANGVAAGAGVLDWLPLLWRKGLGEPEKSHPHHGGVGLAAGAVLTVVGVILTPQILHWMNAGGDVIGNSVAYSHLLFWFHCSGHVQCGCQHSAIGRQQPQSYEVPDYSIAH